MKYKSRLIAFVIFVFTISVLYVISGEIRTETSREDSRPERPVRRFGYLQDKLQEVIGIRKVKKHPEVLLKDENEIRERLMSDKADNDAIMQKDGEKFVHEGRKSASEQAFEKAISRKFRRIDDNRQLNEVNGRTLMHDESVERLLQVIDGDMNNPLKTEIIKGLGFGEIADALGRKARDRGKGFSAYSQTKITEAIPNWERFHMGIRRYSMYDPNDDAVDGLLYDMATEPFSQLEMMEKGTELKLLVKFPDGGKAVFKPMRWGRDYEVLPNHYYFNDFERHHSEIASFHLDRVLGFYRVPPVTGRLVNMTSEIFMLAQKALKKTFYVSPAGNLCFYGDCTYYCDSRHSFCGNEDMLEGSLMIYLPSDEIADRKRWKSPWRRSYSKFKKAVWETNDTYCENVKHARPYSDNAGKLLLDIIDMHIFDFITGNMDRHHVELFREFSNNSFLIHLDNGRGFGKANYDEFSILAPLRQCCLVRESTFIKLTKLYLGPERLSEILDLSLQSDPVYPILTKGHLNAVDRRVILILRTIARCVERSDTYQNVIIKDEY